MVTNDMSDDYDVIPDRAELADEGWDKARQRHHLARHGLIRYQINGALGGTVVRWSVGEEDGNSLYPRQRTANQAMVELDK